MLFSMLNVLYFYISTFRSILLLVFFYLLLIKLSFVKVGDSRFLYNVRATFRIAKIIWSSW
jgi:hypothetical protein